MFVLVIFLNCIETILFSFLQELGYEPTLNGLSSLNGDMVANSCRRTLTTLIQNAMENVENKILEVLENLGEKMAPVIKDFLLKSTNLGKPSKKKNSDISENGRNRGGRGPEKPKLLNIC